MWYNICNYWEKTMEKSAEKTFVEDLWEKSPELVTKIVKKICRVEEEKFGDRLEFVKQVNGVLKFKVYGRVQRFIEVNNFSIRTSYSDNDYENSLISSKWRRFMFACYGEAYAMQYISKRNLQLDKFMADYEQKYNNQTKTALNEMGFKWDREQTK